MPIQLRQIETFLEVAKCLHFSQAAAELNLPQPAVSRTIRQLEQEIDADLFVRSTRTVELTKAGLIFQAECSLGMSHLECALNSVRAFRKSDAGKLIIGYMDFAIEGSFPAILKEFKSTHEGVTLETISSHTEQILDALKSSKIDIGFIVGPARQGNISTLPVQNDRFVVVLPENHELSGKPSIQLIDLADEPLIMGRRDTWAPYIERVEDLCARAGFTPNIIHEADRTESILAFVAAGIGSTIYTERAFNYHPPGVCVRLLDDVSSSVITKMAWRSDNGNSLVHDFIEAGRMSAMAS